MHSDMSGIDQTSSDTTGVQYDSMIVAADKMDGDTTPKLH